MTLVGAIVTSEFVVQVSDRRLTKGGKPFDEKANKAIALCSHMAFGYSGIAYFGQERVDDWIVENLLQTKMGRISDIFLHIMEAAEDEVSSIGLPPSQKHLAIVVTGWVQNQEGGSYVPFISTISNGLDEGWNWTQEAGNEFKCRLVRFDELESNQVALYWLGQPVPHDIDKNVRRALRKRRQKGDGPSVSVHLLVNAIRSVAASNVMVNDDLMAVSVPLEAVGRNFIETSLKDVFPEDQVASQNFFSGSDEGIRYQPHYLGCYGDQFFSITHGKTMTGVAARRVAEMAKYDHLLNRINEAQEEGDMELLAECLKELAEEGKENRERIHNLEDKQQDQTATAKD